MLNIPPAPEIDGATHLHSGKVRDLYRIDGGEHAGHLLMVASDRISAFDYVLETTIPDKGEILTRMSLWWFDQLVDLVPQPRRLDRRARRRSRGRAVVCERSTCSRSSAWPAATSPAPGCSTTAPPARSAASRCPPGLEDGSRLPEPIFTPATKAELGDHDENVSYDAVVGHGRRRATPPALRDADPRGLRPRRGDRPRARDHPGRHQARVRPPARTATIVLADEVLTPDSSALLAGRRVAARPHPAVVRQADRPQLAALPGVRLGPRLRRAAAAAARRGRRADPGAVRRGVRAADRRDGSEVAASAASGSTSAPSVAFDYLVDPRNRPEWQSSLRRVEEVDR